MIGHTAVNGTRLQADLDALAEFRDSGEPGWTRRVFSEPYAKSRRWLEQSMGEAGLHVRRDTAGNLIGTLPGAQTGPAIVLGSHTDTVTGGGRFDGPVGVLGAIEVARCAREGGRRLEHELRVVDFVGEEPNDFGLSCVGSRAVAGTLTDEQLSLRNPEGMTLASALATVGGDAARISEAAWTRSEVLAFLELHIEQGPVLERAGVPVGIVSGIVGIERLHVTLEGAPDHAGTTPMTARHDALCAAAETVLAVERLASGAGGVGTVGRIAATPGAVNVVPGRAEVWLEFRHLSDDWLSTARAQLESAVQEIGERRGVATQIEHLSRTAPVTTSQAVREAMSEALRGLGIEPISIASGAGHDSVQMARLGPVGMLFVPSAGGRSHCPEEWTEPADLQAGVSALLATVLALDAR